MRCALESDESAELIVGYGARTLDPETAVAFERHIDSCAACCRAGGCAKGRVGGAGRMARMPLPVSPDFDQRLFRRIQAYGESRLVVVASSGPGGGVRRACSGVSVEATDSRTPAARAAPAAD